jgi:DNA-binding transcriptional MerR regulator
MTMTSSTPAASEASAPAGPMMHIGQLAERSEMSLRTIRHYDETGLLRPSGRTEGGFRLYTERDLERLLVIRRMKPLGYSLEQMGEVLAIVDALRATTDEARAATLREELGRFADAARERRETLTRHLAWADEYIDLLEGL